ncbi:MAG TPA: (2Fe-2S) ferredoxin domain-containing protein [Myxococcaceae bacterium]|nr:(2Fe-2S) ferredoxin domain-containing protein [Myxococcaceae bacterium]
MAPPYQRHVFVCTNRRADGNPKGCCATKGAEAIKDKLKAETKLRGLKGAVRVGSAGCLDTCEHGVSVVVYGTQEPQGGTWYARVTLEDVPAIIDEHLVGGRPVERLLMSTAPAAPAKPEP